MAYEIVYGKEGGSEYKVLASPPNYTRVDQHFPSIPRLMYPDITPVDSVVFCCTQAQKQRSIVPQNTILSCIKFFSGRAGNYFAQHLILDKAEEEKIVAGPAWLIKRRKFYIQNLSEWSERDIKVTEEYGWRPDDCLPYGSDYNMGTEKKSEVHIQAMIESIAGAWNGDGSSDKCVPCPVDGEYF